VSASVVFFYSLHPGLQCATKVHTLTLVCGALYIYQPSICNMLQMLVFIYAAVSLAFFLHIICCWDLFFSSLSMKQHTEPKLLNTASAWFVWALSIEYADIKHEWSIYHLQYSAHLWWLEMMRTSGIWDSGLVILVTRSNENLNSPWKHDLTIQMANSAIISLGWDHLGSETIPPLLYSLTLNTAQAAAVHCALW